MSETALAFLIRVVALGERKAIAAIEARDSEMRRAGMEEAAHFLETHAYVHSSEPPFHRIVPREDEELPDIVMATYIAAIRRAQEAGGKVGE